MATTSASRTQVLDALRTRLAAVSGVTTCSRTFKLVDQVPAVEQPAVYISYLGENSARVPGNPPIYTINVGLTIYAPAASLCSTIDAIAASIRGDGEPLGTTLGGRVEGTQIRSIEADEGLEILGQGGARITLEITFTEDC